MALQNYSTNESLQRIYQALSGGANPDDVAGLLGQMSINEALARIAQLLEGSDGTFTPPTALTASETQAGVIKLATTAQANDGLDDSTAMTPYDHTISHEFGGIYVSTGTVFQSFTANTWVKITGAFTNAMANSGEVDCDYDDDRLVMNEQGYWFLHYRLSLLSSNGGNVSVRARPYAVSGTVSIPEAESSAVFSVSGSCQLSGFAPYDVTTDQNIIDIRLKVSSTSSVKVDSAQFFARKEVGAVLV